MINNGSIIASHAELLLKDGEFELIVSKPISYAPTQSEVILSKELNDALGQLADHLIEDPSKQLLITGLYTLKEANESSVKNVGSARAENLKSHLISLGMDPSSIYTSAKLSQNVNNQSRFKGVEFSIIDRDRKVNTNPLFTESTDQMIDQTAFILPYYTRSFDKVDLLTSELNNYIERILESPNMALVLSVDRNNAQSEKLLDALNDYISELTYGLEIKVVKDVRQDETVSDRDKQIVRIDIGIKRFQNNLELLGS